MTTHEECIKYNFVARLINSVNIRKSSGAATRLFQFLSYATELNENALSFFPVSMVELVKATTPDKTY